MCLYISVLYSFRSMSLRQAPQETTVIMKKRLNWTVNSMFLSQTTALAIRAQTLHRTRLDQNWSRMKVWRLIFCLTMDSKGYLTFAVFAAIPLIICKLVCTQLCVGTTDVSEISSSNLCRIQWLCGWCNAEAGSRVPPSWPSFPGACYMLRQSWKHS